MKQPEAARAWLRSAPVTVGHAHEPAADDGACRSRSPPPASRRSACPRPSAPASLRSSSSGMTDDSRSRRLGRRGSERAVALGVGRRRAPCPHVLVMFFAAPGGLAGFVRAHTGEAWKDGFERAALARDQPSSTASSRSGSPTASASPRSTGRRQRDLKAARNDVQQRRRARRVPARLSQRVRQVHRPAAARRRRPKRGPAAGGRRAGQEGPRAQRHLPRDPPAAAGRRGLLAVPEPAGRRRSRARPTSSRPPSSAARRRASRSRRCGQPQGPASASKPEALRLNEFTFDDDPRGVRCPIGAHVRRANPRNTDYPGRPTGLARLHRRPGLRPQGLPRRPDVGRALPPHPAPRPRVRPGAVAAGRGRARRRRTTRERGLHFICLNANIGRQFEFLQNAWMIEH